MATTPTLAAWRPTPAHLRAAAVGLPLAVAAIAVRRPDLLVLATPLLVIALWSVLDRPREAPRASARLVGSTLREGEETRLHVVFGGAAGMRQAVTTVHTSPWLHLRPRRGVLAQRVVGGSAATLDFEIRSTRWGEQQIALVVAATSSWGGYRWGPVELPEFDMTTLPLPAIFDAAAPAPHPSGLVGVNRSPRPGDGSEFAGIRPFHTGDRLRRIHWPVSLRTGDIHVSETWADQDTQVVLVVDATSDVGVSEGVDGAASSLDTAARAAGAICEHYLHRGDRVGLRIFGKARRIRLPASTGKLHLRRMLDILATMSVQAHHLDESARIQFGLEAGALVIMLSPLFSATALGHAVTLSRQGLTVVVVDTLPRELPAQTRDPYVALAWRIRLLQREADVRRVTGAGIPIVPWLGPGSLDQVLRDIGRRASAPRMARR